MRAADPCWHSFELFEVCVVGTAATSGEAVEFCGSMSLNMDSATPCETEKVTLAEGNRTKGCGSWRRGRTMGFVIDMAVADESQT